MRHMVLHYLALKVKGNYSNRTGLTKAAPIFMKIAVNWLGWELGKFFDKNVTLRFNKLSRD